MGASGCSGLQGGRLLSPSRRRLRLADVGLATGREMGSVLVRHSARPALFSSSRLRPRKRATTSRKEMSCPARESDRRGLRSPQQRGSCRLDDGSPHRRLPKPPRVAAASALRWRLGFRVLRPRPCRCRAGVAPRLDWCRCCWNCRPRRDAQCRRRTRDRCSRRSRSSCRSRANSRCRR
jgi:hypothetical protein